MRVPRRLGCVHRSAGGAPPRLPCASPQQGCTDSNYGAICSLYDHLFGTAQTWTHDQQLKALLGLEYFSAPKDSSLPGLLLMPARSDFNHTQEIAQRH